MLDIADNSGVKSALCIKVLGRGGSRGKMTRPVAGVGDIVCVAIKKSLPNCQLDDKKVHKCVIIRTKSPVKRTDGSYVRFDSNAAVMIDADGNPTEALLRSQDDRLKNWRLLQELAGVLRQD